ncbi:MAG: DUF2505 domain-containing protein [Actinomycetota bacterium]
MNFEITHSFDAHPDEVAGAMLDKDYQRSLKTLGKLRRELLDQKAQANGDVMRRTRCVLDIEISGVAKNLMGEGDPAWVEEATWNEEAKLWRFTIDPEIAKELLEAKGTIQLSGNENGALRTVEGQVKVKVPFYGGKVEGWIVDGLKDAYDEEAERLRAWLGS